MEHLFTVDGIEKTKVKKKKPGVAHLFGCAWCAEMLLMFTMEQFSTCEMIFMYW